MSREISMPQTYCAQFEITNNTPICTKCGKYIPPVYGNGSLEICKCEDEKNCLGQTKLSNSTTNQEVK